MKTVLFDFSFDPLARAALYWRYTEWTKALNTWLRATLDRWAETRLVEVYGRSENTSFYFQPFKVILNDANSRLYSSDNSQ